MPAIYEMTHTPEVTEVLESLRNKCSENFGVTLVGNRLTLRWYLGEEMVDVHMVVENVTTKAEARELDAKHKRYEALIEKYKRKCPDLDEELAYAETGEYSQ